MRDVRERSDLVAVVAETVALHKRGRDFVGLCPFHQEKTPSLHVSADKQLFYCFGCGAGGDVVAYVMRREHRTFAEAVELLAGRLGLTVPVTGGRGRRRDPDLERLLARAATWFAQQLAGPGGSPARAYLERRGVTAPTVAAFGLGWAPGRRDGLLATLVGEGASPEQLVRAGLAAPDRSGTLVDRFRERVMFPIAEAGGRVVGFGGRAVDDRLQPKYLNSPDTELFHKSRLLYGLSRARTTLADNGEAILVEGYMDVVMAHQGGFGQAVASLGTALTGDHARLLARFARSVVVAYDPDRAGQEATMRGVGLLAAAGLDVRVAQLPEGLDPDEVIKERGSEALQVILTGAVPWINYRLDRLLAAAPAGPEGRARVARDMAAALGAVADPVLRAQYTSMVEARLGTALDMAAPSWKKKHTVQSGRDTNSAVDHGEPDLAARMEARTIGLAMRSAEARGQLAAALEEIAWSDARHREIAAAAVALADRPDDITSELVTRVSTEAAEVLAKLSLTDKFRGNESQREMAGNLGWLRRHALWRQAESLTGALARAHADLSLDRLPTLIMDYREVAGGWQALRQAGEAHE